MSPFRERRRATIRESRRRVGLQAITYNLRHGGRLRMSWFQRHKCGAGFESWIGRHHCERVLYWRGKRYA